ncbi:hypothetical protein ACE6H2_010867 [Prunus campanulata]
METARSLGLPVGCQFEPSETELLAHYLYNKVNGLPLSSNAVIECDLYGEEETWRRLFDETGETSLYFFTELKKKTAKGSRVERTSLGGCVTWRNQSDKAIYGNDGPPNKTLIGYKRTFSYVPKKTSTKAKGEMVMHEFRLAGCLLNNNNQAKDYVLCRIINKQKLQPTRLRDKPKMNIANKKNEPNDQEVNIANDQKDQEMDIASEVLKLLDAEEMY